jgi:hypothetical protein
VDQRALGELAERAAEIAERGGMEATAELGRLVKQAARQHHYAPWAVTSMIAGEWDRLGIRRIGRGILLNA